MITNSKRELPPILIIDDDPTFRVLIEKQLLRSFRIFSAGTSEEAIRWIETLDSIHFMITDMDLKDAHGLDGFSVAVKLRERHPSVPIILMTGNDRSHPRVQSLLRMPETHFVSKIYAKRELEDVLAKVCA